MAEKTEIEVEIEPIKREALFDYPKCPADQELFYLIRARYNLIYVVTWEEMRVVRSLEKICDHKDVNINGVQVWDVARGLSCRTASGETYCPVGDGENGEELKEPDEILDHIIKKAEENRGKTLKAKGSRGPIYVLHDFFRFLEDPKAETERRLKVLSSTLKKSSISIVITSPELRLPLALEKVVTVMDYPLPGPETILTLVRGAKYKTLALNKMTKENAESIPEESIVKALLGLTIQEAEDALAKALVISKRFDTKVLCDLKRQIIRKGQILDYVYSEDKIDDIGGLAGVKQWIRTRKTAFTDKAREYPLPYPKGVFLLGVQGTGKSLCAKVIANELGVPLLKMDLGKVFAPHIGESLAPNEEILLRNSLDGSMSRITMEEAWIEKPKRMEIESYTSEMSGAMYPIQEYIRHKRTKRLMDIKTASGRKISVTEDHSLFTLSNDGLLEEVKPIDMVIGTPIAIPLHVTRPKNHIIHDFLEIIKKAREEDKWFISNGYSVFGNDIFKIVGKKNIASYEKTDCAVGLDEAFRSGIQIPKQIKLQGHSSDDPIKNRWVMSESISELMGWFLADGSIGYSDERLSVHANEVEEVSVLCKVSGFIPKPYTYGNKATIFVHGSALGNALRLIGMKEHRIPSWVFGMRLESREALLRGLFSGDGGISGENIEISSTYEKMASDILKLLASVGIFASMYPRNDGGFRVRISVPMMIKKYASKIGFTLKTKRKALKALCKRSSKTDVKIPLISMVANACKENRRLYGDGEYRLHSNRNFVRKSSVIDFIPEIDDWELMFDPIKTIEPSVEQSEYVYDISVPKTQNFVAGNILCHNSEGNIRRALRLAESIAPCVLFIDEIDMSFSGSASSVSFDSGVSSRVITTIMDWMQERTAPVFLVACANSMRLPAAVLRKGRFDERFFVDLPSAEEREAIFKIHLKKRNRNPDDFAIERLVGCTNGFSGAEIEAVVVDAMTEAFADGGREVLTKDLLEQVDISFPLSKTMKIEIDALRDGASQRMRLASVIPNQKEELGDQDDLRTL